MENATKALMMAGGVLLGVLIISLAVYVSIIFSDFGKTYSEQQAAKNIAMYNSKFEQYAIKEI